MPDSYAYNRRDLAARRKALGEDECSPVGSGRQGSAPDVIPAGLQWGVIAVTPLIIVAVGLIVTLVVSTNSLDTALETYNARFLRAAERRTVGIFERFVNQFTALERMAKSLEGRFNLITNETEVAVMDPHIIAACVDVQNGRSLTGAAYAQYVLHKDRDYVERKLGAAYGFDRLNFTDFTDTGFALSPEQTEYAPVITSGTNNISLIRGVNLLSDPGRREAAVVSRAWNVGAASPPLAIQQTTAGTVTLTAGLAAYCPVFSAGYPTQPVTDYAGFNATAARESGAPLPAVYHIPSRAPQRTQVNETEYPLRGWLVAVFLSDNVAAEAGVLYDSDEAFFFEVEDVGGSGADPAFIETFGDPVAALGSPETTLTVEEHNLTYGTGLFAYGTEDLTEAEADAVEAEGGTVFRFESSGGDTVQFRATGESEADDARDRALEIENEDVRSPRRVLYFAGRVRNRLWNAAVVAKDDFVSRNFFDPSGLIAAVGITITLALALVVTGILYALRSRIVHLIEEAAARDQHERDISAAYESTINYATHELRNPLQVVLGTTELVGDALNEVSTALQGILASFSDSPHDTSSSSSAMASAAAAAAVRAATTTPKPHSASGMAEDSRAASSRVLARSVAHVAALVRDVESVSAASRIMDRLISDLVDIQNIKERSFRVIPVPLNLHAHVCESLAEIAQRSPVPLSFTISPAVPPVVALDGLRIRQILRIFLELSVRHAGASSARLGRRGHRPGDRDSHHLSTSRGESRDESVDDATASMTGDAAGDGETPRPLRPWVATSVSVETWPLSVYRDGAAAVAPAVSAEEVSRRGAHAPRKSDIAESLSRSGRSRRAPHRGAGADTTPEAGAAGTAAAGAGAAAPADTDDEATVRPVLAGVDSATDAECDAIRTAAAGDVSGAALSVAERPPVFGLFNTLHLGTPPRVLEALARRTWAEMDESAAQPRGRSASSSHTASDGSETPRTARQHVPLPSVARDVSSVVSTVRRGGVPPVAGVPSTSVAELMRARARSDPITGLLSALQAVWGIAGADGRGEDPADTDPASATEPSIPMLVLRVVDNGAGLNGVTHVDILHKVGVRVRDNAFPYPSFAAARAAAPSPLAPLWSARRPPAPLTATTGPTPPSALVPPPLAAPSAAAPAPTAVSTAVSTPWASPSTSLVGVTPAGSPPLGGAPLGVLSPVTGMLRRRWVNPSAAGASTSPTTPREGYTGRVQNSGLGLTTAARIAFAMGGLVHVYEADCLAGPDRPVERVVVSEVLVPLIPLWEDLASLTAVEIEALGKGMWSMLSRATDSSSASHAAPAGQAFLPAAHGATTPLFSGGGASGGGTGSELVTPRGTVTTPLGVPPAPGSDIGRLYGGPLGSRHTSRVRTSPAYRPPQPAHPWAVSGTIRAEEDAAGNGTTITLASGHLAIWQHSLSQGGESPRSARSPHWAQEIDSSKSSSGPGRAVAPATGIAPIPQAHFAARSLPSTAPLAPVPEATTTATTSADKDKTDEKEGDEGGGAGEGGEGGGGGGVDQAVADAGKDDLDDLARRRAERRARRAAAGVPRPSSVAPPARDGTDFDDEGSARKRRPRRPRTREAVTPALGLHVLVVDDDRLVRELISRMVHRAGCTTEVLEDGDEVEPLLRKRGYFAEDGRPPPAPGMGGGFHIILMDIVMVRSDGGEVTQRLVKELGLRVPVIAVTANHQEWDRDRFRASGFWSIAPKPVEPGALISLISRAARSVPTPTADIPEVDEGGEGGTHDAVATEDSPADLRATLPSTESPH